MLLGHTTVCAVEIMPKNREMLLQRQRDGVFPQFPIWDDVRTFDGKPWAGRVQIVSGGFPCQDISVAGKGAGLDGERSGLWSEFARIIGEVRPIYAFIENSPALVTRGLDRVLCDLAAMGFDAEWGVIGAHHVGAPHKRDRIWILANCERNRRERQEWSGTYREARIQEIERCDSVADSSSHDRRINNRLEGNGRKNEAEQTRMGGCRNDISDTDSTKRTRLPSGAQQEHAIAGSGGEYFGAAQGWPTEPRICRVVDGVADWKHRIFALGNGQVPRVAATAWRLLHQRLEQ